MPILLNPQYHAAARPSDPLLDGAAVAAVTQFLAHCFAYAPTPLVPLPTLAHRLNLGAVWLKDEGARRGLRSFKALGGGPAPMTLPVFGKIFSPTRGCAILLTEPARCMPNGLAILPVSGERR